MLVNNSVILTVGRGRVWWCCGRNCWNSKTKNITLNFNIKWSCWAVLSCVCITEAGRRCGRVVRAPPGGGLPSKKDRGARRKFWKEPLRGTKILFYVRGLKFFFTLRGPNSKDTIFRHIFFSPIYPKRYCKSSCCGPFGNEHPKSYQNGFFNP